MAEPNKQLLSSSIGSLFSHVKIEHLVAGTAGGVASTLVLHPLDLVKVRFQVNEGTAATNRPQYRGMGNALMSIWKSSGIRGLYQGVTPNVWGAGTSWGLYFLIYNAIKTWMQAGDPKLSLGADRHMLASCEAGFLTLCVSNPLWVVKVRMCLQYEGRSSGPQYSGMWDALRKTYVSEGIRGLYKGFVPGIFGISHGALQFVAYEELKKWYFTYQDYTADIRLGTTEYLVFAALSKMFAATATYPYQVVRARMQEQHRQYNGMTDVIRLTWRHEGVAGFYKGLLPGLLRVTPACCITFVVYESIISYLHPNSPQVTRSAK